MDVFRRYRADARVQGRWPYYCPKAIIDAVKDGGRGNFWLALQIRLCYRMNLKFPAETTLFAYKKS
jgi:hypothetical protein